MADERPPPPPPPPPAEPLGACADEEDDDKEDEGDACLAESDDEEAGGLVGPCFEGRGEEGEPAADAPQPPQQPGTKTSRHDASWGDVSLLTIKPFEFKGAPPGPTRRSHRLKSQDPLTCFREFFTDEMEELAYKESIRYIKYLQASDRPHYVKASAPWPPKWTETFDEDRTSFKRWLSALIGLAGHGQAGGGGGPNKWWAEEEWNVNKPPVAQRATRICAWSAWASGMSSKSAYPSARACRTLRGGLGAMAARSAPLPPTYLVGAAPPFARLTGESPTNGSPRNWTKTSSFLWETKGYETLHACSVRFLHSSPLGIQSREHVLE